MAQLALPFLLLLAITHQQVDHTPIPPHINHVRLQPIISTVPAKHSFKASFDDIGQEISGSVYETNEGLLSDQIHNSSFYSPSRSCFFYHSDLQLELVNDITLREGWTVESSYVSEENSLVNLLVSDDDYFDEQNSTQRVIVTYRFNETSYEVDANNISISSLGLNNSETLDIEITEVDGRLLATDGVKLVAVDLNNPSNSWILTQSSLINSSNHDYAYASANQILKFQLCHMDHQMSTYRLVIIWNTAIRVYDVNSDITHATLKSELLPPAGKLFYDAITDVHNYYGLIDGELVAFRGNKQGGYNADFVTLESKQCWQLNKVDSTLHMICKESGLNYVAEFYLNESFVLVADALKLNRYYTQVDDARLLFKFGSQKSPKLMISGDNDLFVTAYAVNREILLNTNKGQTSKRYKALGIEQVDSIEKYSNKLSTFMVGVGTRYLTFFKINQSPPEIECFLQRSEGNIRWNILVEINTTAYLPDAQGQQLESISQVDIPYTLYVSLFEIDRKKSPIVHILGFTFLAVLALVILGCGFHCKTARNKAIAEVQRKLAELRGRKKQMKPI